MTSTVADRGAIWVAPATLRDGTPVALKLALIRRFSDLLSVDSERVRLWTFTRAAAKPQEDWNNDRLVALARAIAL